MPRVTLRAEGLTKRFGDLVAVDGLSLEVREGEVLALLGPNGAGKTTSIHMICGLLTCDGGRVSLQGSAFLGDPEGRARVGMCPQEIVLWDRLTCLEQLQHIGEMYDLPPAESRRRGRRLLADLALEERGDQLAGTLSGGMRRRLNLAMALVHDPEILILDEPEAGLDPQSRVRVREYIRELARTKAVLLSTHDMDEAERLADRVAILDHGRLLVTDSPDALRRNAGGGDVIEIRLALQAQAEAALTALAGLAEGNAALAGGDALLVRARDGLRALPQVVELLEAAGLAAHDVRLRRCTLEDVFLELTGRKLRE